MQSRQVLEHLEDLAERLGVEIVYQKLGEEEFSVRGGLCKVNGSFKVFIDRSKPVEDRIKILAHGLSSFDTEEVYLFPYIREILDNARRYP
ncbi:MAG: hypothetical protein A2Z08_04095 [Deltaproteobacteria bacterium RBG_16_54_11]|jgi:hypothetical protein|nr:MAG: hypothetical protein A2Z08_04095 [Deltaproteobacteria bacterium RBG_16_54_11]